MKAASLHWTEANFLDLTTGAVQAFGSDPPQNFRLSHNLSIPGSHQPPMSLSPGSQLIARRPLPYPKNLSSLRPSPVFPERVHHGPAFIFFYILKPEANLRAFALPPRKIDPR
jgi:hypothetical protein